MSASTLLLILSRVTEARASARAVMGALSDCGDLLALLALLRLMGLDEVVLPKMADEPFAAFARFDP